MALPTINAVSMRGGDRYRSSVYIDATLTKAAVKQYGLKVTAWQVMPGDARGTEGQTLIQPGVALQDGTTRDLCVYVSMANVACAYDANSPDMLPTTLWTRQLGRPVTITKAEDEYLINPHAGAYSTGCLDSRTGILYAVVWTSPDGSLANATHQFHAIHVATGQPVHPPINFENLSYTAPGGTTQRFRSAARKQRAALLLLDGTVFVAFGSVSETAHSARGWVVAYDTEYQALTGAWCSASSPKGFGGGIWHGGGGIAADDDGYVYVITGNGTFDGIHDFGESVVRLLYVRPARGGFAAISVAGNKTFWTDDALTDLNADGSDYGQEPDPKATNYRGYVQAEGEGLGDLDLGSGAPLINPRHKTVLAMGKHSVLYTVPLDMGRTTPADLDDPAANYATLPVRPFYPGCNGYGLDAAPDDPRTLPVRIAGRTRHLHGEMVLWTFGDEQRLFCWTENSNLMAYRVEADGSYTYLGCSAEVASEKCGPPGGMPGGMIVLSWNGADPETAVLWASIPYGDSNAQVCNGRFLAYDPMDFGQYSDGNGHIIPIWDSEQAGISYLHNKFNRPAPSGRVFLPTYGGDVAVFSLNT